MDLELISTYIDAYGSVPQGLYDVIDLNQPTAARREEQCNALADTMEYVISLGSGKKYYDQDTFGSMQTEGECESSHCQAGWYAGANLKLYPTLSTYRFRNTNLTTYDRRSGPSDTRTLFSWTFLSTSPLQRDVDDDAFTVEWMGLALGLPVKEANTLFDSGFYNHDLPQTLRNIAKGDDPADYLEDPCDFGACFCEYH